MGWVWWSSRRERAPGNRALTAVLGCFSRGDAKTLLSEYLPAENELPNLSALCPVIETTVARRGADGSGSSHVPKEDQPPG